MHLSYLLFVHFFFIHFCWDCFVFYLVLIILLPILILVTLLLSLVSSSLWFIYFYIELQWMLLSLALIIGNSVYKGFFNYYFINNIISIWIVIGLLFNNSICFIIGSYGKLGFFPFIILYCIIYNCGSYFFIIFDYINKWTYINLMLVFLNLRFFLNLDFILLIINLVLVLFIIQLIISIKHLLVISYYITFIYYLFYFYYFKIPVLYYY